MQAVADRLVVRCGFAVFLLFMHIRVSRSESLTRDMVSSPVQFLRLIPRRKPRETPIDKGHGAENMTVTLIRSNE